jgi:hypothetical protein
LKLTLAPIRMITVLLTLILEVDIGKKKVILVTICSTHTATEIGCSTFVPDIDVSSIARLVKAETPKRYSRGMLADPLCVLLE